MILQYDIWGHTDRGRRRPENQDAILFSLLGEDKPMPKIGISAENLQTHGHLMAVADGVGGVRGGREASELLINALAQTYYQTIAQSAEERLEAAIIQANALAVEKNRHENASSTLVAATIHAGKLYIAHVGDSRAYLIRNGQVQRLTEDHALGNRLTRYLVSTNSFSPTMHPAVKLEKGDRVLLCSDGLFRPIKDQTALLNIIQNYHAEEATYRLIGLANAGGGHDNISVVLAYVDQASIRQQRGKWESL